MVRGLGVELYPVSALERLQGDGSRRVRARPNISQRVRACPSAMPLVMGIQIACFKRGQTLYDFPASRAGNHRHEHVSASVVTASDGDASAADACCVAHLKVCLTTEQGEELIVTTSLTGRS